MTSLRPGEIAELAPRRALLLLVLVLGFVGLVPIFELPGGVGRLALTAAARAADAEKPADAGAAKKGEKKRADAGAAAKKKKGEPAKDGENAGDQAGSDPSFFDAAKATDTELELLQSLAARRSALDSREKALDLRVAALAATEKRIAAKLAELGKLKAEIEALLEKHDKEEEAKIRSLVKIYENMKPKSAARILERLDMKVVLDVLERMREAKTAPIMAKMAPQRANEITAELAARRRLPDVNSE